MSARFVIEGRITPGDLLVFLTYLKNTFRPVREYAKYSARLAMAAAAGERVVTLLDTRSDMPETTGALALKGGALTFEGVTFCYGTRPVLDGLDLAMPAGQSVAVTGASGAGKSKLVGLALRLQDPQAGSVTIDGQDLRTVSHESLRQAIGFVPQESILFRCTLAENIAIGAGRELTAEEIEAAARLANAHEFIADLPEGYDTPVAERGATLSAGQRQRIAIARAALRRCPILILDEPTTGLDGDNEAIVTDAIRRLAKGRTSLLITHDLSRAAHATVPFSRSPARTISTAR